MAENWLADVAGNLGIFAAAYYITPWVVPMLPMEGWLVVKTLAVGTALVFGANWVFQKYIMKRIQSL